MFYAIFDSLLVAFRQFELVFSHFGAGVILIVGHLSYDVEEVWNRKLFLFFGSFDSQKCWLAVNIQVSFNQKVLLGVNEALANFLQGLSLWTP